MAWGPGKYDDICTMARDRAGISAETGGGVMVIVMGGNKGNGFSYVGDALSLLAIPDILESVVQQMREGEGKA
jgi:hypothetical protein